MRRVVSQQGYLCGGMAERLKAAVSKTVVGDHTTYREFESPSLRHCRKTMPCYTFNLRHWDVGVNRYTFRIPKRDWL